MQVSSVAETGSKNGVVETAWELHWLSLKVDPEFITFYGCSTEQGPLFVSAVPLAYTQNNHTKIVLIKLFPDPLTLASYLLTLY